MINIRRFFILKIRYNIELNEQNVFCVKSDYRPSILPVKLDKQIKHTTMPLSMPYYY